MKIKERIITNEAEAKRFITEQTRKIRKKVWRNKAICFVSGGVDSSVVAVLGVRALGLGNRDFQAVIVENGLMREGEISAAIKTLGLSIVKKVDASELFFERLKGKVLPYDKRTAIRSTFYDEVLPEVVRKSGAKFFLQGTILTDIEATAINSKAPQHNVLKQVGEYLGIEIIEPLADLRKPSVRLVAKALGLPESIWNRMPFPGPALAARIVGEITREKVEIIRKVTAIVEKELVWTKAFQYFPVLVSDMVPNFDRTKLGYAIVVECIKSKDATTAEPFPVDQCSQILVRDRICRHVPEVLRVAWDYSTKPEAAIEWV